MFFGFVFIFFKNMFSENGETNVLEVLEIKLSLLPNHDRQIFPEFLKNSLFGFDSLVVASP